MAADGACPASNFGGGLVFMDEDQSLRQVVTLLKKYEPGFLPYDLFVQLARLTVLSIIEFVPVRIKDGKVQILLLDRGPKDPIWPNTLHTPGTVIRPTDTSEDFSHVFDRIISDELQDTKAGEPVYVDNILHQSTRGTEQAQVFWVELFEEPKIGTFYDYDNLPTHTMESQLDFIALAATHFKRHKGNT